jgi:hypothetical protein
MFLSLSMLADVALRDNASRMDEIMRTLPVRNASYLGAKFIGAYAVACLTFLGVVLGYASSGSMPWMSPSGVGSFRTDVYALVYITVVLPNIFATGAILFAVAKLTHRLMATYLVAFVLLMLFTAMAAFYGSPAYRTLAALLDPFGVYAFLADTSNWTLVERATRSIPLDGLFVWNRLVWIGAGCVLLALSFTLFNTRTRRPRVRHPETLIPAYSIVRRERPFIEPGSASTWDQLMALTRHEAGMILRSWTFRVLLVLGVALSVGVLYVLMLTGKMPDPPTSTVVVTNIASAISLFVVLLPIAYGGELIWRDRRVKIAEIVDATPAPSVVFLASKLIALALVILGFLAVAMVTGIVFQLASGGREINLGFYLIKLSIEVGMPALMYGVLAIFLHTLVNRKSIGFLLILAVLICVGIGELLVENKLFLLFYIPEVPLARINLPIPYVERALWCLFYWTFVSFIIAILSYLLWVRGTGSFGWRLRRAYFRFDRAVAVAALIAIVGAAVAAGIIVWNDMV